MSGADAETVLQGLYGCDHLIPGYVTDEGRRVFDAFYRLAEAAGRVAEAEKALRRISDDMEGVLRAQSVIDAPYGSSDVPRRVLTVARAALAHSREAVQAGDET